MALAVRGLSRSTSHCASPKRFFGHSGRIGLGSAGGEAVDLVAGRIISAALQHERIPRSVPLLHHHHGRNGIYESLSFAMRGIELGPLNRELRLGWRESRKQSRSLSALRRAAIVRRESAPEFRWDRAMRSTADFVGRKRASNRLGPRLPIALKRSPPPAPTRHGSFVSIGQRS